MSTNLMTLEGLANTIRQCLKRGVSIELVAPAGEPAIPLSDDTGRIIIDSYITGLQDVLSAIEGDLQQLKKLLPELVVELEANNGDGLTVTLDDLATWLERCLNEGIPLEAFFPNSPTGEAPSSVTKQAVLMGYATALHDVLQAARGDDSALHRAMSQEGKTVVLPEVLPALD